MRAVDNDQSVLHIAEAIRNALNQPFLIDALTLQISCSIGAAIYPDDGNDELTLSRVADGAMYQAKNSGRDRVCLARI